MAVTYCYPAFKTMSLLTRPSAGCGDSSCIGALSGAENENFAFLTCREAWNKHALFPSYCLKIIIKYMQTVSWSKTDSEKFFSPRG